MEKPHPWIWHVQVITCFPSGLVKIVVLKYRRAGLSPWGPRFLLGVSWFGEGRTSSVSDSLSAFWVCPVKLIEVSLAMGNIAVKNKNLKRRMVTNSRKKFNSESITDVQDYYDIVECIRIMSKNVHNNNKTPKKEGQKDRICGWRIVKYTRWCKTAVIRNQIVRLNLKKTKPDQIFTTKSLALKHWNYDRGSPKMVTRQEDKTRLLLQSNNHEMRRYSNSRNCKVTITNGITRIAQ